MPKRIQMSRQRPWRADNPDAVIVSRPTVLGNPFRIDSFKEARRAPRWWSVSGWQGVRSYIGSLPRARQIAAEEFEEWILTPELDPRHWHYSWIDKHRAIRRLIDSGELRGRDVACWCALDHPCHGDVVLRLANGVDG